MHVELLEKRTLLAADFLLSADTGKFQLEDEPLQFVDGESISLMPSSHHAVPELFDIGIHAVSSSMDPLPSFGDTPDDPVADKASTVEETSNPRVAFRLEATDAIGNTVSRVEEGDLIRIHVFVDDLLDAPGGGIFSAYLDLLYDADVFSIDGEIEYGSAFGNGRWAEFAPGRVLHAGAFAGLTPTGPDEQLFMSIAFQAIADGVAEFQTAFAEGIPYEIGIYGRDDAVVCRDIVFGGLVVGVGQDAPSISASGVNVGDQCHVAAEQTTASSEPVLESHVDAPDDSQVIEVIVDPEVLEGDYYWESWGWYSSPTFELSRGNFIVTNQADSQIGIDWSIGNTGLRTLDGYTWTSEDRIYISASSTPDAIAIVAKPSLAVATSGALSWRPGRLQVGTAGEINTSPRMSLDIGPSAPTTTRRGLPVLIGVPEGASSRVGSVGPAPDSPSAFSSSSSQHSIGPSGFGITSIRSATNSVRDLPLGSTLRESSRSNSYVRSSTGLQSARSTYQFTLLAPAPTDSSTLRPSSGFGLTSDRSSRLSLAESEFSDELVDRVRSVSAVNDENRDGRLLRRRSLLLSEFEQAEHRRKMLLDRQSAHEQAFAQFADADIDANAEMPSPSPPVDR